MTLIQTEPKKIYTRVDQQGWQPGANTIAYYPLENDTNDAAGSYNLTPTNITYTTLNSGLKVATFNGSNSKATTSSFYSAGGNFTTSMWFYGDNITSSLAVMRCNASSDSSGRIWDIHKDVNRIRSIMNGGGAETGTNVFVNNTWYNMIVTYSGTTQKLYINASLINTRTNASYTAKTSAALGYRSFGNDRWWKGHLSRFIYENVARTAQEISDYYNQTKGNYGL